MSDSSLQAEWLLFLEDFASELLDLKVSGASGEHLVTSQPLTMVQQYGLHGAVKGLANDHAAAIVFHCGLPVMPHDVGYDLWAVYILPTEIICTVVFDNKTKITKVDRKVRRFNRVAETEGSFEILRNFQLPIKVRFEGGKSNRRRS
jgi:hypothetical protein